VVEVEVGDCDGVDGGLVGPALDKAVPDETYPGDVVVESDRAEPMVDVRRAVFTLREADLRLQGEDATGARRFVTVAARTRHERRAGACRLAVFRDDDGDAGNLRAALAWYLQHGELDDFAAMAWAPLAVFVGAGNPLLLLTSQLTWAAVLWPLGTWLWRTNREKLVSYGG